MKIKAAAPVRKPLPKTVPKIVPEPVAMPALISLPELVPAPDKAGAFTEAVDVLSKKMDQMLRLMDDQVHLQKVALLEDGHILRFNGPAGQRIALSLPDAQDDYVQRLILRNRNFYETKLLALVQEMGIVNSDSIVCDIGANIGNHSVYFGKVLGAARVLAFEPQPHCYETLMANIALNGLEERATGYNCLVGAKTGSGQLAKFNARNLGGTAFAASGSGDIALVALDDALAEHDLARLDLIKIDVEGMQMEVLRGAEGILAKRHPTIWVELLARDNVFDEAAAYLAQFGYKPKHIGLNDVVFRV